MIFFRSQRNPDGWLVLSFTYDPGLLVVTWVPVQWIDLRAAVVSSAFLCGFMRAFPPPQIDLASSEGEVIVQT